MKEAIGGTWIYGIVLVFIVVFTTFVSVSTNYARAFRIKDELILNIEHYKGINQKTIESINEYLTGIGYSATGDCPDDGKKWFAFSSSSTVGTSSYGSNVNYCLTKYTVIERSDSTLSSGKKLPTNGPIGHPESAYYGIAVFFRLDWPIFRQFFRITITGESSVIQMPKDDYKYTK